MDDPLKILEQISPCLQQWNVKALNIEVASHSENIVYKVLAEDKQQYALRVHRPGYHSLAELASEQVWTDALDHYGINVPIASPFFSPPLDPAGELKRPARLCYFVFFCAGVAQR